MNATLSRRYLFSFGGRTADRRVFPEKDESRNLGFGFRAIDFSTHSCFTRNSQRRLMPLGMRALPARMRVVPVPVRVVPRIIVITRRRNHHWWGSDHDGRACFTGRRRRRHDHRRGSADDHPRQGWNRQANSYTHMNASPGGRDGAH